MSYNSKVTPRKYKLGNMILEGQFESLNQIDSSELSDSSFMGVGVMTNDISMVRFLHGLGGTIDERVCVLAAKRGNPGILRFCLENVTESVDINYCFENAAFLGNTSCLRALYDMGYTPESWWFTSLLPLGTCKWRCMLFMIFGI